MFNGLFQKNIHHDRLHTQLNRVNITTVHRDRSCEHCYPPELVLSDSFSIFWTWYSLEYPAQTFTRYTQQYFEELSYSEGEDIWTNIVDLICSIRYSHSPTDDETAL